MSFGSTSGVKPQKPNNNWNGTANKPEVHDAQQVVHQHLTWCLGQRRGLDDDLPDRRKRLVVSAASCNAYDGRQGRPQPSQEQEHSCRRIQAECHVKTRRRSGPSATGAGQISEASRRSSRLRWEINRDENGGC